MSCLVRASARQKFDDDVGASTRTFNDTMVRSRQFRSSISSRMEYFFNCILISIRSNIDWQLLQHFPETQNAPTALSHFSARRFPDEAYNQIQSPRSWPSH